MKQDYTTQLMDSIAGLESIRNQLFDHVINVGMHGVYKDIHAVLEPGDSYKFELAHFEDSDDESLQTLVKLLRHVDYAAQKMLKINNLSPEQVDV